MDALIVWIESAIRACTMMVQACSAINVLQSGQTDTVLLHGVVCPLAPPTGWPNDRVSTHNTAARIHTATRRATTHTTSSVRRRPQHALLFALWLAAETRGTLLKSAYKTNEMDWTEMNKTASLFVLYSPCSASYGTELIFQSSSVLPRCTRFLTLKSAFIIRRRTWWTRYTATLRRLPVWLTE